MLKKLLAIALTVCMSLSFCTGLINAAEYGGKLHEREVAVKNMLTAPQNVADDERITIMVELSGDAALKKSSDLKSTLSYQDSLLKEQTKVKKEVEKVLGREINIKSNYTLLFNGFAFEGTADMIRRINTIDGVTAFAAPVFDLPETIASTELISATEMWDLGYTGKGTTVAIIDTGILDTHEAFAIDPDDAAFDKAKLESIYNQYGEYMHSKSNVNKLYSSAKIPFEYDYYFDTYGAKHTASDHGTHVAGIAAGNNGKGFKGVAYDAQIFAMQVFTDEGGAPWDKVILALEDCAYLGVDSINMSLGSTAGFSTYYEESYVEIFDLLEDAGIAISASAGNEGSTATNNAFDGYQLANNPDSGLVSSPSTWADCISVASSENATVCAGSITVGSNEFSFLDPFAETDQAFNLLTGRHDYVICGFGSAEDFANVDVKDKIAVVSRGNLTFTEKANNANAVGAKALIVYNNQPGVINMSIESEIPAVSVLQASGDILISNATNSKGKLTVKNEQFIDYSTANVISSFSSRGTTADLKIKPEITAPGGSITSSVGFGTDSDYETWNGTSMSSPHVAGGIAIVKQYVEEKFPQLSAKEQLDITYAIVMSTATELEGELVRSQGAGLLNLLAAVSTNAYLTDTESSRPKLELGESPDGRFTLEFKVVNFGNTSITYNISTEVDIDTPYVLGVVNGKTVYATDFEPLDVTEDCKLEAPRKITVKAGETKTVKITIDMEELLPDIREIYESGTYAEGFVTLTPETVSSGNDEYEEAVLSIPFLGFVGDWEYAAVIDDGAYYWQSEDEVSLFSNSTLPYNYFGSSEHAADLERGAGINPYGDGTMPKGTFSYDRIAVSPTSQVDYIAFSLLRNVKNLNMHVEDRYGNTLYYLYQSDDYQWKKEFFAETSYTYSDLQFSIDYDSLKENETVYVVLEAYLDSEAFIPVNNRNAVWRIPVTKDTTAPYITDSTYRSNKLSLDVFDTMYVASISAYSDTDYTNLLENKLYYADARAHEEKFELSVNKTENPVVYITVADYAGNERNYIYNATDNTLTEDLDLSNLTEKSVLWSDSFENSATYEYWDTLDSNNDGITWGIANAPEYAKDGSLFAYSYSWDSDNEIEITPDDWIISPNVTIPDDGNRYMLSFDIAATGYDEYFSLYIGGENAITESDFSSLGGMTLSNSTYQNITVDLSSYAGRTVRFAWRHHNCTGGNFIRLDAVEVYYDKLVEGNVILDQGFETSYNAFTTYDADNDGKNFTRVCNEGLAASGIYAMFSASFDTAAWENIDTDNWLISKAIEIPAAPNATYLSFDAVSIMDMHDSYEVYVGTSADPEKMTTLIYRADAAGSWQTKTLNLSAFAGKTVYIAFRHICSDGMILGIDNVKVFSYEREQEYMVCFKDTYSNKIVGMNRYVKGAIVDGFPTAPEYDDYACAYWDYNDKPINKDITINSVYKLRGDLTLDDKITTGDAVKLLRVIVQLDEMTEIQANLADMNRDGKINTGDAIAILKKVVGL